MHLAFIIVVFVSRTAVYALPLLIRSLFGTSQRLYLFTLAVRPWGPLGADIIIVDRSCSGGDSGYWLLPSAPRPSHRGLP